jgi:hypothetical protein
MGPPPLAGNNITSRAVSLPIPAKRKFISAALQVLLPDPAKESEAQIRGGWQTNQSWLSPRRKVMTKARLTLIACTLLVSAYASTISAVAQSVTTVATVNVPFTFHIDKQEMPAGLYSIGRMSSTLFVLRGTTRSATVLTRPTDDAKVPAQGHVVFHRIGGTYFLGELWSAGDKAGMACFESRAERQMLQESKQRVPSLTTLAVNSTPRR